MSDYLEAAYKIGQSICADAIWYEDRCTWIAPSPRGLDAAAEGAVHRTMGSDVYAGTAGVALFLGHLATASGDPVIARTALGAIRHALAHASRCDPAERFGLYVGAIGVAVCAAQLGETRSEPGLTDQARMLARRSTEVDPTGADTDLMTGLAGGVLGLLWLAERTATSELVETAQRWGRRLLARAHHSGRTISWPTRALKNRPNLTGLSHGTAGIGLALARLHQRTGESRFDDGAEAAWAYERRYFDQGASNWPDFRWARSRKAAPVMTAWCHGAPGIALSRLAACRVSDDALLGAEADLALRTCAGDVEASLPPDTDDFTLCHGLTGNAEVLRHGAKLVPHADELVERVARAGLDHYLDKQRPWPTGDLGGPSPALMVGDAGIGLFYLRFAAPDVPSALTIGF